MDSDRAEKVVRRLQWLHIALVVGLLLYAPASLRDDSSGAQALLSVAVAGLFGLIYFGLRARREWVVPLVLVSAAFACLQAAIVILHPAGEAGVLVTKVPAGLALWFFGYQLAFFSRPEVRALFKHHGRVVF
jgi:hypothetical protein